MKHQAHLRREQYELDVVRDLQERGWIASKSVYTSRTLVNEGVSIDSNFPLKIKCRATTFQPFVHEQLEESGADVIFYRKIIKEHNRFVGVGDYVMLSQEDFLNLVDKAYK